MTNQTEIISSRQFATACLIGASSTKLLPSDAHPALRCLFGCAVTTACILSTQPGAEGSRAIISVRAACAARANLLGENSGPFGSVFLIATAFSLFQLLSPHRPHRGSSQTNTNPHSSNQRRESVRGGSVEPNRNTPPLASHRSIVLPPSDQTREPVGAGQSD
jgi:hypothetical protein